MTVLTLLLGILVVVAITAVTGYFVAQEFAYMAVDRSRLNARAAAGDVVAERTLRVTKRTSFMLSGAQLGITVTGLLVGYVAEPLIGESLGELLGVAGVPVGVGIAVGTVLALVLSTVVQMVFGELFPKNLAIARPEPVARWLSRSTLLYLKLFGWLVWVFDQASNTLLRALRIEPVHDVEHSATARDLEHIVADSRESGDLPAELSMLLDRILDFPKRDVEHAMIPRARVDVVRADDTLGEVRALMCEGHSRYPVLGADDDDILGVVHLVEVLGSTAPLDTPVSTLVRDALILPTLMSLPDALRELDQSKNQLACVVDEYGGFAGVLTTEDIAEELVGEITDEHDDALPILEPDDDGIWNMAGDVHIDEAERAIGYTLPRGDYETIAGLVIAVHGELPEVGERLMVELPPDPGELLDRPVRRLLEAVIVEIDHHVPSMVRVSLVETDDVDGGEER